MKTLNTSLILALLFFVATSCSQELTYQEALDKNRSKIENAEKLEDAEFLVEAKSLNMLETQLNQLAAEKGYSSLIVNLGSSNLQAHQELSEKLTDLANQEDIKLPSVMNEDHQELLNELVNTDRDNFDKEYIRAIKRANEMTKNRYMDMATEAYDEDVRSFSARNLDILRTHEEEIESVQNSLLNTY